MPENGRSGTDFQYQDVLTLILAIPAQDAHCSGLLPRVNRFNT